MKKKSTAELLSFRLLKLISGRGRPTAFDIFPIVKMNRIRTTDSVNEFQKCCVTLRSSFFVAIRRTTSNTSSRFFCALDSSYFGISRYTSYHKKKFF
ncbi:hypothetical protein CDAR_199101 [Caerostris darwini]|uniref:Uncharacterized protein n=1 Tax=Caerostris darwini TaxID=1538125 RepID=A0AAV4WBG1_9ARAC|nr:hypothetical protein CDAR_199101 [Caerostris darwini]